MTSPLNLPAPGRCQAVYFMFSISHSHVFLLNSRLDLFSAAPLPERPLSRSYRTILPSSLTVTHSSASVYSTQLRVSESVYAHIALCMHAAYFQVRLSLRICLQKSTSTPFNRLFRQPAGLSHLRPHFAHGNSNGILTVSSICIALRLSIRPRLTLIRLTLIRKP